MSKTQGEQSAVIFSIENRVGTLAPVSFRIAPSLYAPTILPILGVTPGPKGSACDLKKLLQESGPSLSLAPEGGVSSSMPTASTREKGKY